MSGAKIQPCWRRWKLREGIPEASWWGHSKEKIHLFPFGEKPQAAKCQRLVRGCRRSPRWSYTFLWTPAIARTLSIRTTPCLLSWGAWLPVSNVFCISLNLRILGVLQETSNSPVPVTIHGGPAFRGRSNHLLFSVKTNKQNPDLEKWESFWKTPYGNWRCFFRLAWLMTIVILKALHFYPAVEN